MNEQVPVFGDQETITVDDLKVGDFVVEFPPQMGIRGCRVDSGVRDLRPDYNTWTRSSGYRRPRLNIESRIIMFHALKAGALNYPTAAFVVVRRPQS